MEDYKQKYKDALERAKEELGSGCFNKGSIEYIFPELKESAGEKIREALIDYFEGWQTRAIDENAAYYKDIAIKDILAWLEKLKDFDKQLEDAYKTADEVQYNRGYQDAMDEKEKFVDVILDFPTNFEREVSHFAASILNKEYDYTSAFIKISAKGLLESAKLELEKQDTIKDGNSIDPHFGKPITITETKTPKFKVCDWVVCEITGSVCQIKNCIENLSNHKYGYNLTNGGYIGSDEVNHYHLWTIQDAKDGDVLAGKIDGDDYILIFKQIKDGWVETYGHYYDAVDRFCVPSQLFCRNYKGTFHPATKKQCGLLFQKMEEEGYAWDSEKKECRAIPKLKVGDWIVTNTNNSVYRITEIPEEYKLKAEGQYRLYSYEDNTISYCWKDDLKDKCHLWTIQDAKDGDVLYSPCCKLLWIYKDEKTCYVGSNLNYNSGSIVINKSVCIPTDVIPATKKQCGLLFQKMAENGYAWDSEKKELKLLITNGGDFEPELSQISVTKKSEQEPTNWTEEDEGIKKDIKRAISVALDYSYFDKEIANNCLAWLEKVGKNEEIKDGNSIDPHFGKPIITDCGAKEKIQEKIIELSQKEDQVWSEEDEKILCGVIDEIQANKSNAPEYDLKTYDKFLSWLKSIKERLQ